MSQFDTVEDALTAIAAGEMVVVVDDRENEGDLIMAASKASPEQVAFMIWWPFRASDADFVHPAAHVGWWSRPHISSITSCRSNPSVSGC